MFSFMTENLASIIVGAIVLALVAAVVVKMIKDKKNHKLSCGCAGCPNSGNCHQ